MIRSFASTILALTMSFASLPALAQDITVSTVTRPPFSMVQDGKDTGFSIELWEAVAQDLGRDFKFVRHDSFGEMLAAVQDGASDVAISNISITSARELEMDFTHPIFASGLGTMIHANADSSLSILWVLASWELFFAILGAFGLLLIAGMLMWRFERDAQEYFDKPAKEAVFPAFWWALNLVVNGGFEERAPRTILGRMFGVVLVISSLFIVSIFVARITAVMTVSAIESSVSSVNDLYGKRVGTVAGSTAANFLEGRDIRAQLEPGLDDVLIKFKSGNLDAVVFDAPILSYYVLTEGADYAELAGPVFQRESYGIALSTGSPLIEPINQSLLKFREDGTYSDLHLKWFGERP